MTIQTLLKLSSRSLSRNQQQQQQRCCFNQYKRHIGSPSSFRRAVFGSTGVVHPQFYHSYTKNDNDLTPSLQISHYSDNEEEKNYNGSTMNLEQNWNPLDQQRRYYTTTGTSSSSSSPLMIGQSSFSLNRRISYTDTLSSSQWNRKDKMSHFHTTSRKEIIPLIGVGLVVTVGVYSYKALKQMDKEWEDYEEALKEYKLEHGIDDDDDDDFDLHPTETTKRSSKSTASMFKGGTMAIDLGSFNVRVAHLPSSPSSSKPSIVVNRVGSRATPNCIILDDNNDDNTTPLTGQMALDKLYELNGKVLNDPRNALFDDGSNKGEEAVQAVIASLARDALDQVLGSRNNSQQSSTMKDSIFAIDVQSTGGGFNTQPVYAYPPASSSTNNDVLSRYQEAVSSLSSPPAIAKFFPEPLCALIGAKSHNILPSSLPSATGAYMVIDVGGKTTSISIVNETSKKVLHHSSLRGLGGETIVEALMNYLSQSFYGVSQYTDVQDGMGLQRLYDASKSAVLELGGTSAGSGSGGRKSRVQVNIPYLSVDEKMQPKHLDLGVSAKVLEAEFNSMVVSSSSGIVTSAKDQQLLSQSLSQGGKNMPEDVTALFRSMIMQVFETSGQNPFSLDGVLVVGGGARSPMFLGSIKAALSNLAGEQFVEEKLVVPKEELVEELVVLGAAVLGTEDSN